MVYAGNQCRVGTGCHSILARALQASVVVGLHRPQPLTQTGPRSRTRQTDCPQGKLAVGPCLWDDSAALNSPDGSYLLHWSRSQLHLHSFQPGPPHAQRRCICMSHTQMHLHWEMNSDIRPTIGKERFARSRYCTAEGFSEGEERPQTGVHANRQGA